MKKFLYNDLYETEEKHWWHIAKRKLLKESVKNIAKNKKTHNILDIGCGTGKNIETLSEFGTVWGIDKSSEALIYCRKRGLKRVKKADIEKLPFKDNFFDIITALDIIEHVDDKKALTELKRVLKPSGKIIIMVPAYKWLWSNWDVILEHKRRYTTEMIKVLLLKKNFKISKLSYVYSYLLIPVFLFRFIKSKRKQNDYTSDFRMTNPMLHAIFTCLSNGERNLLRITNIPFGTSVLCIAENGYK